jgi:hypothetical protein
MESLWGRYSSFNKPLSCTSQTKQLAHCPPLSSQQVGISWSVGYPFDLSNETVHLRHSFLWISSLSLHSHTRYHYGALTTTAVLLFRSSVWWCLIRGCLCYGFSSMFWSIARLLVQCSARDWFWGWRM